MVAGSSGPALDDPLAHRLGERVAVGPAQAAGPLGADPDQLVLDPLLAGGLGRAGGGEQPGAAVLLLRLLPLLDQDVDAAGAVLDLLALRQAPRELGVEVDVVLDRRLGDAAAAPAGDVRRRDVHVVDVPAGLGLRLVDPVQQVADADDVGGEPLVDRRVERHVAGAVHDRVDVGRQLGYVGQVALDHRDAGRQHRLDAARRLDELGEDRLLEQLGDPVRAADRPLGPDQHRHPHVGHLAEQQVQQRLAHEAGDAGQQHVLTREPLRDRSLRPHGCDRAMCPRGCDERGARPPPAKTGGSAACLLDLLLDEQEGQDQHAEQRHDPDDHRRGDPRPCRPRSTGRRRPAR